MPVCPKRNKKIRFWISQRSVLNKYTPGLVHRTKPDDPHAGFPFKGLPSPIIGFGVDGLVRTSKRSTHLDPFVHRDAVGPKQKDYPFVAK